MPYPSEKTNSTCTYSFFFSWLPFGMSPFMIRGRMIMLRIFQFPCSSTEICALPSPPLIELAFYLSPSQYASCILIHYHWPASPQRGLHALTLRFAALRSFQLPYLDLAGSAEWVDVRKEYILAVPADIFHGLLVIVNQPRPAIDSESPPELRRDHGRP